MGINSIVSWINGVIHVVISNTIALIIFDRSCRNRLDVCLRDLSCIEEVKDKDSQADDLENPFRYGVKG